MTKVSHLLRKQASEIRAQVELYDLTKEACEKTLERFSLLKAATVNELVSKGVSEKAAERLFNGQFF